MPHRSLPPLAGDRAQLLARCLDALRAHGLRITRQRRSIADELARAPGPVTAASIHAGLQRRRLPVDLASVHRALGVWAGLGLVHGLSTRPGLVACVRAPEAAGCRHLVCEACGLVESAHLPAADGAPGFIVTGRREEWSGRCRTCEARRGAVTAPLDGR
jgi:Fe2+ or Zn2+ uptake regulation protein